MNDELDPDRLTRLLRAVAALPTTIEPEHDAWPAIRRRIAARPVVRAHYMRWVAAAVAVLMAAYAVGAVMTSRHNSLVGVTVAKAPPPFNITLARYDAAATDLAGALRDRRAQMDPAAGAVVDTCLARIDSAIAETRHALDAAPASSALADLLASTYEQKIDLLKRAASLPVRGS